MTRPSLGRLTRNAEGPILLESFLVAAVASFLGIRAFLALTGYPQVGSNGIHIAHMLWGGLLMVVALMLLLAYLDRPVEHVAAVIAGLGFGTFIDEIGKFVTSDNNYFFRPAIALIYTVFIAAFLVGRTLLGEQRRLSRTEALANALYLLAGTLERPIDTTDRARIQRLLGQADSSRRRHPLCERLPGRAARCGDPRADPDPDQPSRWRKATSGSWPTHGPNQRSSPASSSTRPRPSSGSPSSPSPAGQTPTHRPRPSPRRPSWCRRSPERCASASGWSRLRESRLAAYRWFMRGLLIWILITQVFVFYSSQLAGLGGLVVDLVAYGSLRLATILETSARPE